MRRARRKPEYATRMAGGPAASVAQVTSAGLTSWEEALAKRRIFGGFGKLAVFGLRPNSGSTAVNEGEDVREAVAVEVADAQGADVGVAVTAFRAFGDQSELPFGVGFRRRGRQCGVRGVGGARGVGFGVRLMLVYGILRRGRVFFLDFVECGAAIAELNVNNGEFPV